MESKKNHWDYQVFVKHVGVYQKFMDVIMDEYLSK